MLASQRSALPVIFLMVIFGPLAIDIYLPSLPEMVQVFHVDEATMQFTVSLFMMVLGVAQLIAGPLSDKFGRRASAVVGLVFYIAGSLLGASSEQLFTLYLARVLQAFGAACCSVTAFAWIRDNFDAMESGKLISYMGGIVGAVPALAPVIGGVLAVQWGWTSSFFFMAMFAVVMLVGVLVRLAPKAQTQSTDISTAPQNNTRKNLAEIFTNRQYLTYCLAGTLTMGGILCYVSMAPIVAMSLGGLGEFGFSLVFGVLGVLQLLASIIAPRIVNLIGREQTILVGIALALIAAAGIMLVPASNPLLFFIPAAVAGIGFNFIYGTAFGLTLEHFKHCAGLAASIDGCVRTSIGGLLVALVKLLDLGVFEATALMFALLAIPFVLIIASMMRNKNARPAVELSL
ncbi:multidrug effflux MFS transporter [Sansalvadorimonas verongulae]|uniref:multidrug effflux MFS transporter n=1 Tax=Sansalvadorimonas verongulae TaxID=2172824 RepID=UPI0012BCC45E|nr:multidrug effflux MFS transporter [Sansalvadorimonas verongulae]MTI14203.1 Bcr/CflA family efflux MFS transporter [Sansalvadorimonas verongulae]